MAIKKRSIGSNQIDGSKVLFNNNEAVRSLNASGEAVSLLKLDASNVLQFLQLPQVASDPQSGNDVSRKSYVDSSVSAEQSRAIGVESSIASALATVQADYLKRDGSLTITGNVVPDGDETRSLGSSTANFANVWSSAFTSDNYELIESATAPSLTVSPTLRAKSTSGLNVLTNTQGSGGANSGAITVESGNADLMSGTAVADYARNSGPARFGSGRSAGTSGIVIVQSGQPISAASAGLTGGVTLQSGAGVLSISSVSYTSGSNELTLGTASDASRVRVGCPVSAFAIPNGSTVIGANPSTGKIWISANVTSTSSSQTLSVAPMMIVTGTLTGGSTTVASLSTDLVIGSCVTTSGSATVTCSSTLGMAPGLAISGDGIPASTTIASIQSLTEFTLSANATASATVSLTVAQGTIINTVRPGAGIVGSGVASGTTISSVNSGAATLVLSTNAQFSGTAVPLRIYGRSGATTVSAGSGLGSGAVNIQTNTFSAFPTTSDYAASTGAITLSSGSAGGGARSGNVSLNTGSTNLGAISGDIAFSTGSATSTTLTGSLTSGTANVTVSSTAGLVAGMPISGTGIPTDATISSITSTTVFVMSANATATNASVTITVGGRRGRITMSAYEVQPQASVVPSTNGTLNLGSSSFPWSNVYSRTTQAIADTTFTSTNGVTYGGTTAFFGGRYTVAPDSLVSPAMYSTSDLAVATANMGGSIASNKVRLLTGNSVDGASGDILIRTGVPSGTGARGKVDLQGSSVDVNSVKIVNLANGTASSDAVNKGQLDSAVAVEQSRALAAETSLEQSIASERTRALAAEASLQTAINFIASNVDPVALDSLTEIITAFQAADASLQGAISSLGGAAGSGLTNEISRAQAAEASIALALSYESSRALAAETSIQSALSTSIANEISRATAAESSISSALQSEITRAGLAESSISSALASEITRAGLAESSIASALASEVTRAGLAESSISSALQSEITRAQAIETSLAAAIMQQVYVSKTLSAGDVTAQYVDVAHTIVGSPIVSIAGIVGRPSVDFSVSGARITFLGDWATSGASELVDGDVLHIWYMKGFSLV